MDAVIDRRTQTIAVVLIPRFNMMALTTTLEPLRVANYYAGRTLYAWHFLSVDGGAVTASNGMSIDSEAVRDGGERWDAIFVCGSWGCEHYENAELFAWLRLMERSGARLGAIELGSYVLARAQVLGGYSAAIHWYCSHAFAEEFPHTTVEERLFIVDRDRMTCAGGTAGIDMMLYEIEQRHGRQLALEVADQILHHPIRDSSAPLRGTLGGQQTGLPTPLREAIALMEENIEEPLPIPALAEAVGISQRKLERLFRKHMGASVVGFYRVLRLQFARVLLLYTKMSIREISVACGFASLSHFAKSFSGLYGRRPRDHREAWPESEPTPVWPGMTTSLVELAKATERRRDTG